MASSSIAYVFACRADVLISGLCHRRPSEGGVVVLIVPLARWSICLQNDSSQASGVLVVRRARGHRCAVENCRSESVALCSVADQLGAGARRRSMLAKAAEGFLAP